MSDQDILNWVYPAYVDKACTTEGARERQMLAAFGLMSEAGELGDEFKKHFWHGKPLDMDAVILEMGDVLWYFVLMCINEGISFQEIMERNMEKLDARKAEQAQELSEASIG